MCRVVFVCCCGFCSMWCLYCIITSIVNRAVSVVLSDFIVFYSSVSSVLYTVFDILFILCEAASITDFAILDLYCVFCLFWLVFFCIGMYELCLCVHCMDCCT